MPIRDRLPVWQPLRTVDGNLWVYRQPITDKHCRQFSTPAATRSVRIVTHGKSVVNWRDVVLTPKRDDRRRLHVRNAGGFRAARPAQAILAAFSPALFVAAYATATGYV